jgi:hypothetical protein
MQPTGCKGRNLGWTAWAMVIGSLDVPCIRKEVHPREHREAGAADRARVGYGQGQLISKTRARRNRGAPRRERSVAFQLVIALDPLGQGRHL